MRARTSRTGRPQLRLAQLLAAAAVAAVASLARGAAAAPAAAPPGPWLAFVDSTQGSPAAPPGPAAGLAPLCRCAVLAYTSPSCQAAARAHCDKRSGGAHDAFCSSVLATGAVAAGAGGALPGLARDAVQAGKVAAYLQQQCFPGESLTGDADYCTCFGGPQVWGKTEVCIGTECRSTLHATAGQTPAPPNPTLTATPTLAPTPPHLQAPFSKECAVARLRLCANPRAAAACAALSLGAPSATPGQLSAFLSIAQQRCGLAAPPGAAQSMPAIATVPALARRAPPATVHHGAPAPWWSPPWVVPVIAAGGALALAVGLAAWCACCVRSRRRRAAKWQKASMTRTYSDTAVYVPWAGDGDHFESSPRSPLAAAQHCGRCAAVRCARLRRLPWRPRGAARGAALAPTDREPAARCGAPHGRSQAPPHNLLPRPRACRPRPLPRSAKERAALAKTVTGALAAPEPGFLDAYRPEPADQFSRKAHEAEQKDAAAAPPPSLRFASAASAGSPGASAASGSGGASCSVSTIGSANGSAGGSPGRAASSSAASAECELAKAPRGARLD